VKRWLQAHGTTAAAIVIASVLTLWYGLVAAQSWIGAIDPDRMDPTFARRALALGGDRGGSAATASGIIGLVIGAVVVVSAITIVGLVLRRSWAREAAFGLYGFLGVVAIMVSVGGLMADPPQSSAWVGLLSGAASLSVVVLLLARPTGRDFNAAERTGPRGFG